MSVTWGEKPNSMQVAVGSITKHYVLTGTTSEPIALALALGYSSAIYNTLYRSGADLTQIGPDIWDVEIPYGPYSRKKPEDGDFSWSFDTTGGTKHVTCVAAAADHINTYTNGVAIDHHGAIGVNENNDVEGVDVPDQSFKWTENRRLLLADTGWAYADILGALTGGSNDAEFRGKAIETVLFEGATGGQDLKDPLFLDVTYNFSYSPSAVGLAVGGIAGIAKVGWHHLSVRFATADGGMAKKLTPVAKQVDVDRVITPVDFSTLGIGTT